MRFSQEDTPEGAVMTLDGSFTFNDFRQLASSPARQLASSPARQLASSLDAMRARPACPHILDLSGLEFLDSAARGMLLIAEEEVTVSGSSLTLRRPTGAIAPLLELAAMDKVFRIEP
nr:STAS domain-containing protein [uncultured Lichenicoccus sp.]